MSESNRMVRQQSRFLNLMNDYGDSVGLYEGALESAGTAQSKFNLYLESNQATLDTFRTTIEGLWISILDSDSLMSIVKFGTQAIETLDALGSQFGILGTAIAFIIPLLGVKFVWAVRASQIELKKLAAAQIAAGEVGVATGIGAAIKQMFGFEVATKGASIAVGALTLKTLALTAGLIAIPTILTHIARKARETREAFENALDTSKALNDDINLLESLIKKQEELTEVENKSAEQKKELLAVERDLAAAFPELATGIDEEGNSLADNIELTKKLSEEKRILLEQELLVISSTAKRKLPQLKQELADMQEESRRIQERINSGDVHNNVYSEYTGQIIGQIDVTEKLEERMLKLTKAQREKLDVITELESGVNSYNQILEENAERHKWARAEEIAAYDVKELSRDQNIRMQKELVELGFTSDDVANIMSGNLSEVKEKYDILTEAQIQNLISIGELNEADRVHAIDRLNRSRTLTNSLIDDVKKRIQAIKAEVQALIGLSGARNTYVQSVLNPSLARDKKATLKGALDFAREPGNRNVLPVLDKAREANEELSKLNDQLKNIGSAYANVSGLGSSSSDGKISGIKTPSSSGGGRGSGSSGRGRSSGSSGGTTKEEYKAKADAYAQINLELDRNNVLLQLNKAYQDQAGDDIAKKIKLIEKETLIYKDKQGLLHQYNEQLRGEAKQLQSELSSIFRFEGRWDDNSMKIVDEDMGKVAGKSKDIEEKFNRIIAIMKELPKGSQEWLNLKKAIEDTGVSINELQKQQLSDRLANSKNWIEKRNFYDDWGADNEIAAWERVKVYIEQYYADGIINHKEYSDYMLEIDRNLASEHKRLHDEEMKLYDKEMQKYEEERAAWVSARNTELQAQRDRLSALDSIQEAVVAIIRKRGEEEKKALDKAHKAEMDSLDKRHNKRKEMYKEELDNFNKMIQGKIDAMDEQNAEEDYLEDLNKEREKATELQKEIDVLTLDDSLTARNKTIELRKQLAEQNDKIAKMQQKRERDVTKKSLQDQMKDKQQDVKDREEIADELYNNEKKRLEEEYEINKEYLERKYSDEKVYAEARESIMRGTVETSKGMFEDIYSAYQDFENKFGKGMGILGGIIKKDFLDQLDKAKQAIRDLEYLERARDDYTNDDYQPRPPDRPEPNRPEPDRPSPNRPDSNDKHLSHELYKSYSDLGNMSVSELQALWKQYEDLIDDGKVTKVSMPNVLRYMEAMNRFANLGRGSGFTVSSARFLRSHGRDTVNGYEHGGKLTQTGRMIADFHGTQSSPEWIFNDSQLKKIISDATAMSVNVAMPKNIAPPKGTMSGDKYEIKFDIKGNMDKSILPQVERMIISGINKAQEQKISKFNDIGIRRPI